MSLVQRWHVAPRYLIIENFVPADVRERLLARCVYEEDAWQLKPLQRAADDPLTAPSAIDYRQTRPVSTTVSEHGAMSRR